MLPLLLLPFRSFPGSGLLKVVCSTDGYHSVVAASAVSSLFSSRIEECHAVLLL